MEGGRQWRRRHGGDSVAVLTPLTFPRGYERPRPLRAAIHRASAEGIAHNQRGCARRNGRRWGPRRRGHGIVVRGEVGAPRRGSEWEERAELGFAWELRAIAMRPQSLACERMGAARVRARGREVPAVAGAGVVADAMRCPGTGQRCAMRPVAGGGGRVRAWTGRPVVGCRFAAMSRSGVAEVASQLGLRGNSSVEGGGAAAAAGRADEGLVSSVGTPAPAFLSFRDWYLADKQLVVISFTAFVTAGFMGVLVATAIPSLLAIRKAAEALEKLADTAREELPGTMAAIRLSGMEISDLTMELNDLGQEISKGVRSSARVLSSAGTGMRQVGGIASNVWQEQAVVPAQAMQPLVARTARQMRDSLVQTRTLVRNLQVLSRVSGWIGSLQGRTPVLIIPSDKKTHKS